MSTARWRSLGTGIAAWGLNVARFFARQITLPRVLALAVALLLVATLGWSWRSSRRAALERQLNEGLTAGAKALDSGHFPDAVAQLQVAAEAARGLGATSPTERRALHLEREAQAWSRLSLNPLESWLREAKARDDVERSRRDFARTYKGRTAVFEAWLMPRSPDQAAGAVTLDWVLAADDATLELAVDPADAAAWGDAPEPRLVIFAAEFADVQSVGPQRWVAQLAPRSVVPISAEEPLTRAGRPSDAALREALARQRRELQIEGTP